MIQNKNQSDKSSYARGIMYILAAAFGFSLMTFFVRLAGDLPTMQKAFFRNAVAAVITIGLLIREGKPLRIERSNC